MLRVVLLGSPSFRINGTLLRAELGGAGRLLGCFLFQFMGLAHRRERLADLCWPDLDEERARAALNTAVWRFRRLLDMSEDGGGRSLVTMQNEIVLEPASFITVDTVALEASSRLVARASHTLSAEEESVAAAAVAQYRAPFLEGEEVDWVLHERERMHCLFASTAYALMKTSARRGEFEKAILQGRVILSTDPFRERVQREVMLLLAANGQRVEAIRSYESLRSSLKDELGIAPMPETERLIIELRSGRLFDNLSETLAAHFGTAAMGEEMRSVQGERPLHRFSVSPDPVEGAYDDMH